MSSQAKVIEFKADYNRVDEVFSAGDRSSNRAEAHRINMIRSKEKRTRELRKHMTVLAAVLTIALIMGGFLVFGMMTKASEETATSYKYYTSVMIPFGENGNSVALSYSDLTHYENDSAYLEEVCSINCIADVSSLEKVTAGDYLILPYYSSEYR